MISKAAIRYNGVIYTGRDHAEAIEAMKKKLSPIPREIKYIDGEEGFVTESGKFLNRTEAAKHAFACKQTKVLLEKLHSKNVIWWLAILDKE